MTTKFEIVSLIRAYGGRVTANLGEMPNFTNVRPATLFTTERMLRELEKYGKLGDYSDATRTL